MAKSCFQRVLDRLCSDGEIPKQRANPYGRHFTRAEDKRKLCIAKRIVKWMPISKRVCGQQSIPANLRAIRFE
ncbi:hypothetical protein BLL42_03060 [Pseudomonas frederiksbergensis]|uniref:Uncharacterized protein n=1 Tax=Pseudomonas frederiksbergensis TaxID=104087 RepID=A0A1J0EF77_9PSED|nr:hypothetical protein BLL42_03060 [Pseudomonas frederiksbergensis]